MSHCQFVVVTDDESNGDRLVELPTEEDGMLLLSTVEAQFSGATGLKYRSETGAFRGLRVADGSIWPPPEGWGMATYVVVMKAEAAKRRHEGDTAAPPAKQYSTGAAPAPLDSGETDLIVLGLPWKASTEDVKEYFSQHGQMALCQINMDSDGRSKGFGFIRFADAEVNRKVAATRYHFVMGRRCEVKLPIRKAQQEIPRKLFIGCLTQEITKEDLQSHFGSFGVVTDIYVPHPFRGIAFVTYSDASSAMHCLENAPHVIHGTHLNVATPEPRKNPDQTHGGRGQHGGVVGAGAAAQLSPAASQALLSQIALAATGGAINPAALGIDMSALAAVQQQAAPNQHHQQQQQQQQQHQSAANVRPPNQSYHW